MENAYQTIIIGAGPAGLTAGRYLEDALILDKKKEIGRPVQCGEGISKKALEAQGIEPDPGWISCEIYQVERIMPNGKAIGRVHQKPIGYVIDREKFEEYLAGKVKPEIKLNTEVVDLEFRNHLWEVITKTGEVFRSKYIIGADGPNSIVRRKVFPENQERIEFIPAIEYLVELEGEIDTRTIKIYLDNEKYIEGYAWIFPKSNNTANIGIDGRGNLSKKFKRFLKEIITRDYNNYKLLENRSGTIAFRNKRLRFFKNNVMLVGDAAGLIDPIFHGGMAQAMVSGGIAAQSVLKNEVDLYEEKIGLISFVNPKLVKASEILYSFENETLNELGNILEGKGFSHLKTFSGFVKVLSRPALLKNISKLLIFFSAWQRNKDYV